MPVNKNKKYPILVTVYNRYFHFVKCIESLKACPEAQFTRLYVCSDGPLRPTDQKMVQRVRDYIKNLNGFLQVIPILHEKNVGPAKNVRSGHEMVSRSNDAVIRLEDDVVVGAGFLQFMNDGLRMYSQDPRVVGICGYLPPGLVFSQDRPLFLRRRSAYGLGLWYAKEELLRAYKTSDFINHVFKDSAFFKEYERSFPHAARHIPMMRRGRDMPGDFVTGVVMQAKGFLALHPPQSITKNIGVDGTGLRSGFDRKFAGQEISDDYVLIPDCLDISESLTAEKLWAKSFDGVGSRPLNYLIYFADRFVPCGFYMYASVRLLIKFAKAMLRKVRTHTGC